MVGNSRKLKKLERTMNKSRSYEEWRDAAIEHDEVSGKRRWREVDQTTQYDYAQIRLRLDRIRSLRARHDHQGLLLHSVYHRPRGWDHVPAGSSIPHGESCMWGDYHLVEAALYLQRIIRDEPYYKFFGTL